MDIRVVTIDDEPLSLARIRMFVEAHDDVTIVAEATDGEEALDAIHEYRPDAVFADVQMPGVSGLEMLRRLDSDDRPFVIFTTAFANYAVEAFDVGAVHYLVKPFGSEEVDAAVSRLREAIAARAATKTVRMLANVPRHEPESILERVVVKREGRALLLRVEHIDWIEAAGNYSRLHVGREHHLLREPISSLEKRLDGRRFVRVHRSALVNLDRIRELQTISHGDYAVVLRDDTRLVLSRGYKARLEAILGRL